MTLTLQQTEAIKAIRDFIESEVRVFIMTGYAGTGKTTIIKEIISCHYDYEILLMAPTGRAAKILRERTGHEAATIHSTIYRLEAIQVRMEEDDVETTEVPLYFPLDTKKAASGKYLCIVDEASMVNSKRTKSEDLAFGSGSLLEDLLEFIYLSKESKIIFTGDPVQLPPVGDNTSNALAPEYFKQKGIETRTASLTEILRQHADSPILANAARLRELLQNPIRNKLTFTKQKGEVEETDVTGAAEALCGLIKSEAKSIIITYSNTNALMYNRIVRSKLFPESDRLTPGDILIASHNSYYNQEHPVFNGDFFELTDIFGDVQSRKITIKNKVGDEIRTTIVELEFIKVALRSEDGYTFRTNILYNAIGCDTPDISPMQRRALYIDFCIRHPDINPKKNPELFTKELQKDPYFNALRLKYGYAITGHKSQGGEWDTVFVDYDGRNGLSDDCLRWMYTTTTRARKKLIGIGFPEITPIGKIKVTDIIKKVQKSPKGYYSDFTVPETPFHPDSSPAYLKSRYWAAASALNATQYSIKHIDSKPYRETYTISTPDGDKRYDATYDGNGMFKRFTGNGDEQLTSKLNDLHAMVIKYRYTPSNDALGILYSHLSSLCSDLEITITNVIEDLEHFNVKYCLKSHDHEFAYIDFWIDRHCFASSAIASSSIGDKDLKLKELINALQICHTKKSQN